MNLSSVDLAHHSDIKKWVPQIGDIIVWHGWLQHYFGVVSNVIREENAVEVIKSGLPLLLFSLTPEEHNKNKIKIDIGTIKGSTGGKYATARAANNNITWFV